MTGGPTKEFHVPLDDCSIACGPTKRTCCPRRRARATMRSQRLRAT